MINPDYYNPKKAKSVYLGRKVAHYMRKPKTVTLTSVPYVIKERQTMYTLAMAVFGDTDMRNWTILSDGNSLRPPDEWRAGEIIQIPRVVLKDVLINKANYELSGTSSTKIFNSTP